ncbi:MAG: hypothetical protein V7603_4783 [Micromonosporaceae bacterium]
MLKAVAVIARARSEAAKAATLPTSSSVAARRSIVCLTIVSVTAPRVSKSSGMDSGIPPVCRISTRMPCGPSSQARLRRSDSTAPNATCSIGTTSPVLGRV